jgi:hypothetical protein
LNYIDEARKGGYSHEQPSNPNTSGSTQYEQERSAQRSNLSTHYEEFFFWASLEEVVGPRNRGLELSVYHGFFDF